MFTAGHGGSGHLRELVYIVAAPLVSLVSLAAFESWWSAALFVSALGVAMFYAVRRHDKHHRSEAYDDKLSTERMEAARKWLTED
jgi:membrane protein implicated in regulation of membrane protease activity